MKIKWLLFGTLIIDLLLLFYSLSELSISYLEALIFFKKSSPLHYIVTASCTLLGQNDFGLRVPFLVLHIASALLIYKISKYYVKTEIERFLSMLFYILLPGVNAAALIVNEASLVIFLTLLFIWSWQNRYHIFSYAILIFSLFIDNSFAILYLILAFYGYFRKQKLLMFLSIILFGACMYLFGFDTAGKPKGYFLDTLGVYAATFSPLLLLYYIYTLYRITIKERKSLLWFIAFGAFVFAFIFSLRQKLPLEDFLPFAVISVPLMIRVFFNSYRVRLPAFRKIHLMLFIVIFISLIINFLLTINNKVLYIFYENPKKHFAYKHHVAKELSKWLHHKKINSIDTNNEKLALRLQFYGIGKGGKKRLIISANNQNTFKVKYFGKTIERFGVKDL